METLRVQDIHKRFGSNEVLKGVSLLATTRAATSIIGSSGSGKSTLLRCINFLETPDSGRIFIHGEELRTVQRRGTLAPADRRQLQYMRTRLSMVFQHFNLWSHMTVQENITAAPINVLGLSRQEALVRAQSNLLKVGLGL